MKLFLSHSSRNKPLLREIKTHFPPWLKWWIDEEQLLFGDDLLSSLEKGVNSETDFVLLFFCDEAAKSRWVKQEVEWALSREKKENRIFLLPVLLGNVRRHLKPLNLSERITLELKDYTQQQALSLAQQITDHLGGWLVKRVEDLVAAQAKKTSQLEAVLDAASKPIEGHFPYLIDRQEKEVTFELDGSGVQIQKWLGLKANQTFINLEIPWTFIVELTDAQIGITEVLGIRPTSHSVEFCDCRHAKSNGRLKQVSGKIKVHGHLGPGDDPISFQCRQHFSKAFLCTQEEVIAEYGNTDWPEEYTASSPIVAIQTLAIRVRFPRQFQTAQSRPKAIAFVGFTHVLHPAETARIKTCFIVRGSSAHLEVRNPVLGLRYAISWIPPQARRHSKQRRIAKMHKAK